MRSLGLFSALFCSLTLVHLPAYAEAPLGGGPRASRVPAPIFLASADQMGSTPILAAASTTIPADKKQLQCVLPIKTGGGVHLQAEVPLLAIPQTLASGKLPTSQFRANDPEQDLVSTSSNETLEPIKLPKSNADHRMIAGSDSTGEGAGVVEPDPQQKSSPSTTTGTNKPYAQAAPSEPERRAPPAPLDPVFPMTEFIGMYNIGVPDTDPEYPIQKALWHACPVLRKARIKVYGWANPGGDFYSSSVNSNIPLTYAIVPRKLEMDQLVGRIERVPDTVQTSHPDWGFRCSLLYGIDYRWTTAQGWYPATNQLLKHNRLYGLDPVELYGMFYLPKICQGMLIKFGRYISPPDIEAQLAPDNFLWTHSLMFDYDCYTQTGILGIVKLNNRWMVGAGLNAGCDTAPWAFGAVPTGQAFVRWVSKRNRDSIYGGVNAINGGRFRGSAEVVQAKEIADAESAASGTDVSPRKVPAKDNLQQFNVTWSHKFNRRIITMTEGYVLYSINALQGGTVNNGAPKPYFALTGPGKLLSGTSVCWGLVNYTAIKITDKDYICLRPVDYLGDCRGWRCGFPGTYASWTVGWTHRFSDLLCIRPEIRYEHSLSQKGKPYDNGTRRGQLTFGMDLIQRF